MSYDVFISYAAEDELIARRIVEFLQGQGLQCWIDKQNLRFAGKYDREIERAIRRSRVVLWLASSHAVASDYVKFEIGTASNHNKPIGPVYLEAMDPSRLPAPFNLKLANVQGIEWFQETEEANMEKLAAEVRELIRGLRKRQAVTVGGIAAAVLAIAALVSWGILTRQQGRDQAEPQSHPALANQPQQDIPAATPFPASLERLPAAEVLKIAYTGAPPVVGTQSERPTIQMAILARRAGEDAFSVLKDGDSLASERDDYFLVLRPLSRGFLYVFQVDSVGKKTWLFPKNDTSKHSWGTNPVESDKVIQVPSTEVNQVLFLDRSVGVEHVYTVFSAVRWPTLEAALSHHAEPGKHESGQVDASLVAAAVREPNKLLLRGMGGTRPKTGDISTSFMVSRTEGNQTWSVPVSADPLQSEGSFLVIERWFRHVAK